MQRQKALLLNASNKDTFPVYPYAFIQIPAIARQVDIDVICKDLLGIPQEKWKQTIQTLLEHHSPVMVLITLRNTDALVAQEYELDGLKEEKQNAYFPIERTKELITAIREISNLKIAVGGFGFSLLPKELMHYLRPDFGVLGGPDAFFGHFEDIQNGDLKRVESLLFFQGNQLISNPRVLYPPFNDAEYTPQAVNEMMEFYTAFPTPGFQGAPVEIMRGCNHSCVFCAEPHSVGKKVRYRDLSAVMRDVGILAEHGITRLYMVSSELNPEGNEYILELADRIHLFNLSRKADTKITWFGANYLLKFTSNEFEQLYRSGFTGGWFDITSLDDENAHAMRTPYRNAHLLAYLKTYAEYQKKQIVQHREQKALGKEPSVRAGDNREDEFVHWSFFLGNPATTVETIRKTLRTANQEGLSNLFDRCGIVEITRVFDYQKPSEATLAATYSVNFDLKRTHYQQLLPSFAYPHALLQDFSEEEITELFSHIAETYLSKKYLKTRDWYGFVNQWATAASISRWLAELSVIKEAHGLTHLGQITAEAATFHEIFASRSHEGDNNFDESPAKEMVDLFVSSCLEVFPNFFESLGLPNTTEKLDQTTPYELAVAIFTRWELAEELNVQIQLVSPEWKRGILRFCVQAILYRFNIQIKPKYKKLFIPD